MTDDEIEAGRAQAVLLLDMLLAGDRDEAQLMFATVPDAELRAVASESLRLAAVVLHAVSGLPNQGLQDREVHRD